MKDKILVIGASGQIGSELTIALREAYGNNSVYATDIRQAQKDITESGPFEILNVMDDKQLANFVVSHKITQIYHLAAVLSGNAEKVPMQAWEVNMGALMNVLNLSKEDDVKSVLAQFDCRVWAYYSKRMYTSVNYHRTKHSIWYKQACRGEVVRILF